MNSVTSQVSRQRPQPDHLEITNWPLRDDGLVSVGVVALWLGLTAAAGFSSRSLGMTVFVSLALLVTFWRFWVPVRYEVAAQGVTRSLLGWQRRISWGAVAAYRVHRRGVQLLPRDEDSPLAFLQGWYIRWSDQREALVRLVEYYHARAAAHQWSDSVRSSLSRGSGSALTGTATTDGMSPGAAGGPDSPSVKSVDTGSTAPKAGAAHSDPSPPRTEWIEPDSGEHLPEDDATVVRGKPKQSGREG